MAEMNESDPTVSSTLNPAVIERDDETQARVDREVEQLALYYYETNPSCIRVIRTIERLRLKIERRNIRDVPAFREQLLQGGGSAAVPCLLIQSDDGGLQWLYGADAIMTYLEDRFA